MVTAYQNVAATHRCMGGTDGQERSLTAQIASLDLHDFLISQHDVGKVLHQFLDTQRGQTCLQCQ